jgi:hypothetical protein
MVSPNCEKAAGSILLIKTHFFVDFATMTTGVTGTLGAFFIWPKIIQGGKDPESLPPSTQ